MTREQAINYLISSGFSDEQVSEVVRALTYEPTTKNNLGVDCISRADAIKAMQDKAKKLTNEDTINGLCGAVAILFDLPSVTTKNDLGVKKETITYLDGFADGLDMANSFKNEMLDKIRAEIKKQQYGYMGGTDYEEGVRFGLMLAHQILDKYKAETEVEDGNVN